MVTTKTEKYTEAVGRRKRAIARVRIVPSKKQEVFVNDKKLADYFPIKEHQYVVGQPFALLEDAGSFSVEAHVSGGGTSAQAEAIRHGIARAITELNEGQRGALKQGGMLTRDARVKERKKFGLRKARRAPQWSKR